MVFQDNIVFSKFTVMDQMNLMNIVMEEHRTSEDLLNMLEKMGIKQTRDQQV